MMMRWGLERAEKGTEAEEVGLSRERLRGGLSGSVVC